MPYYAVKLTILAPEFTKPNPIIIIGDLIWMANLGCRPLTRTFKLHLKRNCMLN